jgi:hypothetical protein
MAIVTHTTDDDVKFMQSLDARDWAKAFCERVRKNPHIATDEGTMIGWFANALMRGHDEATKKEQARREIRESLIRRGIDPDEKIMSDRSYG